jgi:hypothetical protein
VLFCGLHMTHYRKSWQGQGQVIIGFQGTSSQLFKISNLGMTSTKNAKRTSGLCISWCIVFLISHYRERQLAVLTREACFISHNISNQIP